MKYLSLNFYTVLHFIHNITYIHDFIRFYRVYISSSCKHFRFLRHFDWDSVVANRMVYTYT